ncbi:MAG: DUF2142 domain-containing protein, partial [Oscillospiraceae bacterium]|nr:DUF2142 domain-containing protein [Oscillospiraceae bacterium]
MMQFFTRNRKHLFAALAVLLLAALLEGGVLLAKRASQPDYPLLQAGAENCGSWEFEAVEGGYYALAYNSYFTYTLPEPIAAAELRVFFGRSTADATEAVVYCAGVEDGVAGEFVYPLYMVADGVWAADISMQQLTVLRIYPTETVRSTISFDGFAVNSAVSLPAYSAAELLLVAYLLGAAYYLYNFFKNKQIGKSTSLWASAWLALSVLLVGGAFAASRLFTAAGALGDLLCVAAAMAAAGAVLLLRFICSRKTLEAKAAILAAICALVFCFASLPLQVPDESAHFLRSYTLSCGDLTFNADYAYPNEVNLFVRYFCGDAYSEARGGFGTFSAYSGALASGETAEPTACYIQILLPYVLPAIGMAAVRLLGGGAVAMLYAGRLVNAAMFAAAVFYSVRAAKRYRFLVLLTAFWPLTAFVCGS